VDWLCALDYIKEVPSLSSPLPPIRSFTLGGVASSSSLHLTVPPFSPLSWGRKSKHGSIAWSFFSFFRGVSVYYKLLRLLHFPSFAELYTKGEAFFPLFFSFSFLKALGQTAIVRAVLSLLFLPCYSLLMDKVFPFFFPSENEFIGKEYRFGHRQQFLLSLPLAEL